ncbi:MAG TPA: ATP-binding protein [Candidatus Methylomirabilis sp.]|nr:ATP-binding protein [Candidatus Methylomirabilis sp.]
MHRLYWKIFLSFWAALILFAGATMYAASHFLDRLREQQEITSPFERFQNYAADGQRIAARDGVDGLKKWLATLDRGEIVPLFLLDRDAHDLLGRPVPERLVERLAREAAHPPPPGAEPRRLYIVLPDRTEFRLMPDFQAVTLGRVLRRPRVIALPIVIAAIVSGLVCLLLARYLTAPIGRLRRATEAYAAGDLNPRVAPTLGSRRDEIADLARAFDRMAQRLQELMTSQRQLLSDVSHELRSPLARLQVALGLARQRADGRATAELDRIEGETERLNDLIGQLLSLSRLEAGVMQPEREPIDIGEILAAVAADADFEARANNRRVEVAQVAPTVIQGDAALLHSAIENIVRNAVRYTAENTTVRLSLDRAGDRAKGLTIRIRDYGPGVPEEMLPHLFEPFVRVDDARDRSRGGYGLGLAIAQKAIRLHGGEVVARNEPDGGLSVVITLPGSA